MYITKVENNFKSCTLKYCLTMQNKLVATLLSSYLSLPRAGRIGMALSAPYLISF